MAVDDVLITERRNRLSHVLGYGWTYSALDAGRALDVENIRKTGDRKVYWPEILPGDRAPHIWSWLRLKATLYAWPTTTGTATGVFGSVTTITATAAAFYDSMVGRDIVIATVGTFTIATVTSTTVCTITGSHAFTSKAFTITADGNYDLPVDLESLETEMTFTDQWRNPIRVVGPHLIRTWRQGVTTTGTPRFAAKRPKAPTGTAAQVQELLLEPIPDAVYPIEYVYRKRPDADTTYMMGGAGLGELFIAADAAAAEEKKWGRKGDAHDSFMNELASRVQADRMSHGSPVMGMARGGYESGGGADQWHSNAGDFSVDYINTAS